MTDGRTAQRSYVYRYDGFDAEDRIIEHLLSRGYSVVKAAREQDILEDTDIIFQGIPTSIKMQHAGEAYDNIYFELATQHYTGSQWSTRWMMEMQEALEVNKRNAALWSREPLAFDLDSYNPGWWLFGKAQQYLIWQGKTLKLFSKDEVQQHIAATGFDKVLGLSWKLLQQQNGKNTICGYLKASEVPYLQTWELF